MKQQIRILSILMLIATMVACSTKSGTENERFTAAEKAMCDSLKISTDVISEIRKWNSSKIVPFHYSLSRKIEADGSETEIDPVHLQGLVFDEENAKSYEVVFGLKDKLKQMGYSIFLLDNNFNINDQPDQIGVLKTTSPYDVLRQIGTDGINYDIDNDSLLTVIRSFDEQYALELVGASGDWCEFAIKKEPSDWMDFARKVYAVCPDVVDQGTGTVEMLASEMQRTKRLYFWWD